LLKANGSAWTVGIRDDKPGLERRVSEGVRAAADSAMSTGGTAGTLLADAWREAFGVHPDPEVAYSKAVKAVEAASVPVVLPTDSGATLGKVISKMRVDTNWTLPLEREHPQNLTKDVILSFAQALWSGQNDRHAGQADYKPSTQEAAETAVLLAVPLVQWFSDGTIAQR
jgi:hypothetical protein